MAVRSQQLAVGLVVDAVDTGIFTTGPDRTAIIRSTWFLNPMSGGRVVTMKLTGPTSGAHVSFGKVTLAAGESRVLDHWWVMDESTDLEMVSTGTGGVLVSLFGSVLQGSPL